MRCGIISKTRKINFGYGKHLIETPDTSLTGNVVDATKKHLRNSQHALLLDVQVFYTDKWHVYETLLPARKHVQDKAETHQIERNNCAMRHWFGRFKRKSIIVSKSKEMVDLTIALFARFRANGDVFDILNISDNQKKIPLFS